MSLDLAAFTSMAKTAEAEARSPLYRELDSAFETIVLLRDKNITFQKITEMLVKAGLKDADHKNITAWWNSARVKDKRTKHEAKIKAEAETKARVKSSLASDVSRMSQANKSLEKSKPVAKAQSNVSSIDNKDLIVPWEVFSQQAMTEYDLTIKELGQCLVDVGILYRDGRTYILMEDQPNYFANVDVGNKVNFKKAEVRLNSLLDIIKANFSDIASNQ